MGSLLWNEVYFAYPMQNSFAGYEWDRATQHTHVYNVHATSRVVEGQPAFKSCA